MADFAMSADVVCANCSLEGPRDTHWGCHQLGWALMKGFSGLSEDVWWCPDCKGIVSVGLDHMLCQGGTKDGLMSESLVCAFAFQFGQYCAHPKFARALYDYVSDETPSGHNNMLGPNFVEPSTWGTHGWGRWSTVRREAEGQQYLFMDVAYVPRRDVLPRCLRTFQVGGLMLRCTILEGHDGPCAHNDRHAARWQMGYEPPFDEPSATEPQAQVFHEIVSPFDSRRSTFTERDDRVDAVAYAMQATAPVVMHLRGAAPGLALCGEASGGLTSQGSEATCRACLNIDELLLRPSVQ